jgi:hypothetical protein
MGNLASGNETIDMVPLPAGTFVMGSPEDEYGRLVVEGPRHRVTIGYGFAVGRFPVTVDQSTCSWKRPATGWRSAATCGMAPIGRTATVPSGAPDSSRPATIRQCA